MEKVLFSWSTGKDSAMALHVLKQQPEYKITALLTTITEDYDRVSMHGVRRVLLEQQVQALDLPIEIVRIPKGCPNEKYEELMVAALAKYRAAGVSTVAFGDIFLEDLKKYREDRLALVGMNAVFPIWKRPTQELARSFTDSRFEAVVTCVDTTCLDGRFCGRTFDKEFLAELPVTVDPCGENGEFHTFCYAGPIFKKKIEFQKGPVVLRDNRFSFCDLLAVER